LIFHRLQASSEAAPMPAQGVEMANPAIERINSDWWARSEDVLSLPFVLWQHFSWYHGVKLIYRAIICFICRIIEFDRDGWLRYAR
jgi:hypothetical protein